MPTVAPESDGEGAAHQKTSRDRSTYQQLLKHWHNRSNDEPPPFYPCYHPGLSCDQAQCSCFVADIFCEKSCGCSRKCQRRYQGCTCHTNKHSGRKAATWICHQDERCDCFRLKRECDPDLCSTCGASLVLDGENRYDEAIQHDHCHNVALQLSIPKRTLLGRSKVHGFGLYAGESIKRNEYVGEYQGEVTILAERDRRGEVYEIQRLSYLFKLTTKQDVDATLAGNKMRFINHAAKDTACNIGVAVMFCNSTYRIGMYAKRDIKKGDELFFNYGKLYHEHLVSNTTDGVAAGKQNEKVKMKVKNKSYDGSHLRNQALVDELVEPGGASTTPSEIGEMTTVNKSRAKGKAKVIPVRDKGKGKMKVTSEDLRKEATSRAVKSGRRAASGTSTPVSVPSRTRTGSIASSSRNTDIEPELERYLDLVDPEEVPGAAESDTEFIDPGAEAGEEESAEEADYESEDSEEDSQPVRKRRRTSIQNPAHSTRRRSEATSATLHEEDSDLETDGISSGPMGPARQAQLHNQYLEDHRRANEARERTLGSNGGRVKKTWPNRD